MKSHVGSDDLGTAACLNLVDSLGKCDASDTGRLGQREDDWYLGLEHRARCLGLNNQEVAFLRCLGLGGKTVERDDRTGNLGALEDKLKVTLRLHVLHRRLSRGPSADHDGLALVVRTTRQALPEVFCDERHEGVQELETSFQCSVESVLSRESLLSGSAILKHRLGCFLYVSRVHKFELTM